MVEGRRGSEGGEGRGRTRGEKGGRRGRTAVSCWTHKSSRQQQTHPPPQVHIRFPQNQPPLPFGAQAPPAPRQPRSTPAQTHVSNTASGCPLQARDSQRPKAPPAPVSSLEISVKEAASSQGTHTAVHTQSGPRVFPQNSKPPTQKYSPALSRPPCDSHVMPCPVQEQVQSRPQMGPLTM